MTQNQASLRWKKPGFEQKFLMQGEKQVPETSGCRRFYSDSNINFHLYAYAGNSPVRYTDPDGKTVTNNTDDYIIARLEDPIKLSNGIKIDTVVLAPGEKYLGNVDGTRDKNGNYTKISARDGDNIDYTVNPENQITFDNEHSRKKNSKNDVLKRINNLPIFNMINGKRLLSGSYPKDSEEAHYLSKKWDNGFKEDIGEEGFGNFEKAYNIDSQKVLRKELVE